VSRHAPLPPPSPRGFDAGDVPLPSSQPLIAHAQRERAALLLTDVILGRTPEELAGAGPSLEAKLHFMDGLVRDEALAHVDMLIGVLLGGPRTDA
jgi:hypothetical protein